MEYSSAGGGPRFRKGVVEGLFEGRRRDAPGGLLEMGGRRGRPAPLAHAEHCELAAAVPLHEVLASIASVQNERAAIADDAIAHTAKVEGLRSLRGKDDVALVAPRTDRHRE